MDVETFNAAKEDLEHAYLTHMIDREEYYQELKELRKERQDDRILVLIMKTEPEQPLSIQRRLYYSHKMKLYSSRRKQIFFTGERSRRNSRRHFRRR